MSGPEGYRMLHWSSELGPVEGQLPSTFSDHLNRLNAMPPADCGDQFIIFGRQVDPGPPNS